MFNDQNFLHGPRKAYETMHFNVYNPVSQPIYNASYNMNIQTYQYQTYDNTSNNIPLVIALQSRQNDEADIENFLQQVEQLEDVTDKVQTKKISKICASKNYLASAFQLNKKLNAVCEELKSHQNLSEDEWQEKIDMCSAAKCEIIKLLGCFKSSDYMTQLKKDLDKRKKKRIRIKQKKEQWKNEKLIKTERRARLHAEIDSWIRKEQAVIDREKQEENLRKDADMILSDVRGKRSDARKFFALLKELKSLRNIKANIAKARGEHTSLAADEAFNNIIEKLTEQWLTLDREYSIEEQGLKLMLKTDNEKRIEKQKKCPFDDWEYVLFGRKISPTDQLHLDLPTFVAIRTAWDKYISSDSDASAIPIGWVLPEKPSSAAWQRCLGKEINS